MTTKQYAILVAIAYILMGVKGFPKDNWSIINMWIGFGSLIVLTSDKRKYN